MSEKIVQLKSPLFVRRKREGVKELDCKNGNCGYVDTERACRDCDYTYKDGVLVALCPRCHGKGTVLVDVTANAFANRKERRAAGYHHGKKLEKWLPCPECKK